MRLPAIRPLGELPIPSRLVAEAKHNYATLASLRKSIDLRHTDSRWATPEKNKDSLHRAYHRRRCDRDGIRRERNRSDRRAIARCRGGLWRRETIARYRAKVW